jgi:hypothetical protein
LELFTVYCRQVGRQALGFVATKQKTSKEKRKETREARKCLFILRITKINFCVDYFAKVLQAETLYIP